MFSTQPCSFEASKPETVTPSIFMDKLLLTVSILVFAEEVVSLLPLKKTIPHIIIKSTKK